MVVVGAEKIMETRFHLIHLLMIWEAIEGLSQILAAIRASGMHELGRRGIGNQGSQRTCVAALWPPNAGPDWHRARIWEVSQNGWALRRTENVGVKAVDVGNLVPPNILDTQIIPTWCKTSSIHRMKRSSGCR